MEFFIKYMMVCLTNLLILFLFTSCSSKELIQKISAEDRFEIGKKLFDEGDYLDAKSEFEILKLQFPGSAVADDAQYYLGECYYERNEFLLAAEEYQTLIRNMPTSPLVPLAHFKIAMCYYNLSPKSYLDQQYTMRAIDEFQSFIEYYPTHDSFSVAESKIKEMIQRLAKKDFESAELYMKLEYYKAAIFYYDSVIEKYHDTPYFEPALVGKIKALVARKKYAEAKREIDKFFEKYPLSSYRPDVELQDKIIRSHLPG